MDNFHFTPKTYPRTRNPEYLHKHYTMYSFKSRSVTQPAEKQKLVWSWTQKNKYGCYIDQTRFSSLSTNPFREGENDLWIICIIKLREKPSRFYKTKMFTELDVDRPLSLTPIRNIITPSHANFNVWSNLFRGLILETPVSKWLIFTLKNTLGVFSNETTSPQR